MTEQAAKPRRLSKPALRAWAWIAGALAFFSPWAVLGISPKPAASAAATQVPRSVVIIRKITRRVIIEDSPKAQPVHYVYVGGSSTGGSSYSAPAPTSTGGSAPPP